MMNKNAKKWIEDLRTTTVGQARSQLRRGDNYCCLGRACEISQLNTWQAYSNINPSESSYSYGDFIADHFGNSGTLPWPVMKWLGLRRGVTDCVNIKALVEDQCPLPRILSASSMNDAGDSFPQIADWLEQHQDLIFLTQEEMEARNREEG